MQGQDALVHYWLYYVLYNFNDLMLLQPTMQRIAQKSFVLELAKWKERFGIWFKLQTEQIANRGLEPGSQANTPGSKSMYYTAVNLIDWIQYTDWFPNFL